MRTIVIVDFRGGNQRSPLITSITSLSPGGSCTHFHDPTKYKTPFYRWIAQVRRRYKTKSLRSSKYLMGDDGQLQDGRQGRPLTVLPPNCYSIWVSKGNHENPKP